MNWENWLGQRRNRADSKEITVGCARVRSREFSGAWGQLSSLRMAVRSMICNEMMNFDLRGLGDRKETHKKSRNKKGQWDERWGPLNLRWAENVGESTGTSAQEDKGTVEVTA